MTDTKLPAENEAMPSVGANNCTVTLDKNAAEVTYVQNNTDRMNETMLVVTDLTANDVGKRVCVGNVQTGVLKYLGEMRCNAGLWCGVELDEPVGKHDGCVKGVRYFSCRADCGIMAPVPKVKLLSDNKPNKVCDTTIKVISDARNNDDSGPYSLMEIETPCHVGINVTFNDALPETANKDANETMLIRPEQDLLDNINSDSVSPVYNKRISHIIASNCSQDAIHKSAHASERLSSSVITPPGEISFQCSASSSTPIVESRIKKTTMEDTSASISPLAADVYVVKCVGLNKTIVTPGHSPVDTPSFAKQNSFEFDESLGILTPDQMVEFSTFVESSKTPSSDDLKSLLSSKRSDKTISNSRTPSSENLGSLPHDGFKLPPNTTISLENKSEQLGQVTRPNTIDLKYSSEMLSRQVKVSNSIHADITSPNAVENSVVEFSLGLIDEDMLACGNPFSSIIDTTTNLELPLDSDNGDGKNEDFKSLSRSDQTPSPEDLPLDPIDPIKSVEMDLLDPNLSIPSTDSDTKTDVSKSSATTKTNSFITSVTSITSLDTGYQGDGEMSRPASRGADHSPIAHKPNNPALVNLHWQRAIARRQDPMTDSDFFTESDADVHEENAPRGDRRAQVIDGTLYGVNAQAAAAAQDIFIGNQEEMDSSGIFTDLDMNPRNDDFSDGERNVIDANGDKSPSDMSTKSISENSQEIKETEELDSTLVNETQCDTPMTEIIENVTTEKPKSPTQSIASNPSSRKSPRARTPLPKEDSPNKKFKMPKRNVTSKVKTMMDTKQNELENQENRKSTRKTVSRWDAVMNKISKGEEDTKTKLRLKEVKSKVATGITGAPNTTIKRCETRKLTLEDSSATKSKM